MKTKLAGLFLAVAFLALLGFPSAAQASEFSIEAANIQFSAAEVSTGDVLTVQIPVAAGSITGVSGELWLRGAAHGLSGERILLSYDSGLQVLTGSVAVTGRWGEGAWRMDRIIVRYTPASTGTAQSQTFFNSRLYVAPPSAGSLLDLGTEAFAVTTGQTALDMSTYAMSASVHDESALVKVSVKGNAYTDCIGITYVNESDNYSPYLFTTYLNYDPAAQAFVGNIPFNYAGAYSIDRIILIDWANATTRTLWDLSKHASDILNEGDELADLSTGDGFVYPNTVEDYFINLYDDGSSYPYRTVLLSWQNYSLDGYRVYYKKDGATTWSYQDTEDTYLLLTMSSAGAKYYYKIYGYTLVDGVKYLSKASSPTKYLYTLKAPTLSIARYSTQYLKLTWNDIPGQTGYQIYRATSFSGSYTLFKTIVSTSASSYIDKSTVKGKVYLYKIRAYKKVYYSSSEYYIVYGPFSAVKSLAII